MKVFIAINSFKSTAPSSTLNEIASKMLGKKGFEVDFVNVSDGGDGFLRCFNGKIVKKKVTGPLYNMKVDAEYLIDSEKAYIEIANICGIKYLLPDKLDIMNATTYGIGEVIKDAINKGVKEFYIGLGGTASNDCGFGMARSLGARFFDKDGVEIENNIYGLLKLVRIDFSNFIDISKISFYGICDVKNKLLGINGSARVFGKQKGATEKEVIIIERALKNLTKVILKEKGVDISKIEGGASAGGLAAGIYGFLDGRILNGSEFIIKMLDIDKRIKNSDIVITGEGKLDRSSFYGKITGEIIRLSKKHKKRVIFLTAVSDYKKLDGVDIINFSEKYPVKYLIKNITTVLEKELYSLEILK